MDFFHGTGNREYNIKGGSNITFDVSSGNASLTVDMQDKSRILAPIVLNDDLDYLNSNNQNFRIQGNISGTGGITVQGGRLTFENGNVSSYTGDTVVEDGQLHLKRSSFDGGIGGDLTIGDGNGAAGSAIVDYANRNNQISNTTAITILSDGLLDLTNENDTVGSISSSSTAAQVMLGGAAAGILTVGDATNATFDGTITERGDIVKQGDGTWTLTNNNSYDGTTTINNGVLEIEDAGALGDTNKDTTVNSGGTVDLGSATTINSDAGSLDVSGNIDNQTFDLTVGGNGDTTFSGIVSETGNLVKDGNGTLTLSGVNTYSGSTTINGGSISISADSGLGTAPGAATPGHLTFDGGTLNTTATFTLNSNRGIALNAGGGTIETDPATTLTYGGIIAGAGNLDKTGTGTLVLSGVNTHTGTTTVQTGILEVTNANALGGTGTGNVVQSGATLEVSNIAANMAAEPLTINGTGVGGVGALYWTDAGFDAWTGDITLGSNSTITNTAAGIMPFSGDIDLNGSTLTVDNAGLARMIGTSVISGMGNFVKDGASTWFMIGGTNTYTGSTTVNNGILNMNVAGGTSVPGDLIIGDGVGAAGTAIAFVGSNEQIANTSDVTIDADGRLDVNSFSETIASLTSGSATAEVFLGSGTLTVGDATSTTFAGVISKAGDIVKNGTGTLTLT
jgi:autotransporter-associated beta strand protein